MNAVHLHLMVNHIPILATFFSLCILAWSQYKGNKSFFSLAMIGFIIAGVFSIIALQSGEAAEEIVEHLAGISGDVIHEHEEMAETANWLAVLLGIGGITGLFIQKKKESLMKISGLILLLIALISTGVFAYTAYLGGQIIHQELESNTQIEKFYEGYAESTFLDYQNSTVNKQILQELS